MWRNCAKIVGPRAALIAKLEKPAAIRYLSQILEAADGVMWREAIWAWINASPEAVRACLRMIDARSNGAPANRYRRHRKCWNP